MRRKDGPAAFKGANEVLEAINTIFLKALTCSSVSEIALTGLEAAERLTSSSFGFIGELNPVGRFDTLAMSNPGWDSCGIEHDKAVALIRDMELTGLWGHVLKTGQPFFTNDPGSHPVSSGVPKDHPPLTAFLGVPLLLNDRVVGMIALGNKPEGYVEADLKALETFAVALVQALLSKRNEEKIALQARQIMDISTPVIQVWKKIVVAPLMGILDSERTRLFTERLLETIVETNSSVALIDITAVPMVDTLTAQHIIEAITASRLLGAEVILTGIRPEIAQTLVHLGIDLAGMITRSSLAAGFAVALDHVGLTVVPKEKKA